MNTILLSGTVATAPRRRSATAGSPKVDFYVESLTKSTPLLLFVVAFGQLAELLNLAIGDGVIIVGRLVPSTNKEGQSAGFTLLANNVERIEAAP